MPATFTDLRVLSGQELSRMAAAIAGTYVVPTGSGGAVTANAGMTLSVAAILANTGLVVNGTLDVTGYAGGTTVIATADATNPRRDYVWYDGAGAIGNTSGTAAAAPVLPDLTAGRIALAEIYVAANDTTISGSSEIIDRRHNKLPLSAIKYDVATQTVNASTTFVDLIMTGSPAVASQGTAASEVWLAEGDLPLSFTGTGGFKAQITGPAGGTAVSIRPNVPLISNTAAGAQYLAFEAATTALSTGFAAHNAAAATDNLYTTGVTAANLHFIAYLANGATTGTFTVQIAQNSANGTTIVGIGGTVRWTRIS